MATMQYEMIAEYIWIRTAFSDVPQKDLIFKCCLIHLNNLCKTLHKLFKEAKQLLGLGRCQSNDFDAQIADTTITMIQYILLTLNFRFEHYETKGALFSLSVMGLLKPV